MPSTDRNFGDAIAAIYDRDLVPLIFQPYADDLAARVAARAPARVLEIAAGTGVVTRALAACLPASATLVATDLNPPMLAHAQARAAAEGIARPIAWRQADAMALPFDAAAFDAVACQFGAMFFPDRAHAYAEVRRVLAPGGRFAFNVWDRLDTNLLPHALTQALAGLFPAQPPDFLARVPHGYHDAARIRADLAAAGFAAPARIETLAFPCRAATPLQFAAAFCKGTPLRNEIEARGGPSLDEVTAAVADALAARFGPGPIEGPIQALVVEVDAP